jgi:hypothetical protein
LQIPDQPGLLSETLPENKTKIYVLDVPESKRIKRRRKSIQGKRIKRRRKNIQRNYH